MTMQENNFADILRILKLIGGKFIIVEDGQPRVVLMDYKEFQDLVVPSIAGKLAERLSEIEDINQQITKAQLKDLRQEVVQPEPQEDILTEGTVTGLGLAELKQDEIRIEPLDSF